MTGTNESKQKEVSWMFSFINVVIFVSYIIILYTFSFFSRTYFMLAVYFIPTVIASVNFVKMMVDVCNPRNYTKVKLVFMFRWNPILSSLTNSKTSTRFLFISSTFISNARLKSAEKQMQSNTLRLNFCYLKIIHILHPRYHPKIIGHVPKISKRTSLCVFPRLIIMKMKMKNRSHRYDINRPTILVIIFRNFTVF